MATYTSEGLSSLKQGISELRKRRDGLFLLLYPMEFENPRAQNFLRQGVMRRLSLLTQSALTLFEVLPPETEAIPRKDAVDHATLLLQSHIINVYGTLDCWAHVWANEFGAKEKNGRPLHNSKIGLGKGCTQLRKIMTRSLTTYLDECEVWMEKLANYRHSLAHRVPLYIPPHMVDPQNSADYRRIDFSWNNTLDPKIRSELEIELNKLSHFKAMMLYDLDEEPPIFFHAQVIANFRTLEEISKKFFFEFYEKKKQLD